MSKTKATPTFRNGQWVRFQLPKDVELVVVEPGNKVTVLKPEDPLEVELLQRKMRTSGDGRFVGIYLGGGRAPDGKGGYAYLPACVVPQRAVLAADGSQNLTHSYNGMAATVMFRAETLEHVEAVLMREDLPEHRNATCDKNWNPRA